MKNYFYEIVFSRVALIIFVIAIFCITGFLKQPSTQAIMKSATQVAFNDGQKVMVKLPNGQFIRAEVAKSEQTKSKGLGQRTTLAKSDGMLFVFDQEGQYPFWMKDMKFPIDIIWLDDNYKVVDTAEQVSPPTVTNQQLPTYTNKTPAKYVLEVVSGFIKEQKLATGDKIQLT